MNNLARVLLLVVLVCTATTLSSFTYVGDYVLKISKIDMKKTPQSGDWRAGVKIYQEAEPDNTDAWHGGESKFEGADASLPAKLELGALNAGDVVTLFIGLDDDAEDAGGDKAEDKAFIKFKVFPTNTKDRVYSYAQGDWSVSIHYSLTRVSPK